MTPTLAPFDPASATAEDIAFGALTALEETTPDESLRPVLVDTVRSYAESRRLRGLPVFPNRTVKANAARNNYLRDIFVKPLDQVLPPEAAQKLTVREKLHPEPERYRAREVNRAFLSAIAGKPLTGDSLDLVRDRYAKEHLGLKGDTSDKAVFSAIRGRHLEDAEDSKKFSGAISAALEKRLATAGAFQRDDDMTDKPTPQGIIPADWQAPRKPLEWVPTPEERDAILANVSERNRPEYRKRWNDAQRELTRITRKHGRTVEEITQSVMGIRDRSNPERAAVFDVDALARKLPDDPREREVVMAMIGNALSSLPEDERNALVRIASGVQRGVKEAAGGIVQAAQAQARQLMQDPNNLSFTSDDETEFTQRRALLLDVIRGNGMKLSKATDNLFSQMFVAAAPSAWMFPAAFTPVGQFAIAESLAGQSLKSSRVEYPDMDEGLRTNAATASGIAQAAVESFTNIAGVRLMLGKLPRFAGFLNKFGVASPGKRAALGFAAGYGAVTGMEYTEEAAQGAIDMGLQGLAADLSGLNPEIDWGRFFKDWATVAGPEQKETLLAVSAFGMIAGAGASYNHFRYGSALAKNKTFLRAHGFTEAEVRDITNTVNLDEAAEKTRVAFVEAEKRGPSLTDEQKARLANLRTEALEVLRASNEAYTRAGMPRVAEEVNGFTEETEWVFIDPTTGSRRAFESEEAALGAWQDWNAAQSAEALETIQTAGETSFIETLTTEGSTTEGVNVERVNRTVTPATELADAQAETKAAETDRMRASTPVQERRSRERFEAAQERLNRITARVELFLLDRGVDPTNATAVGRALDSVVIKAKSFATMLQGRVVGYTVQLYNGAEIQDIAEDFAETSLKMAVEEGFADPEILLDDIRRYEEATGAQLIPANYEYDPANPLPLIEGFSKLARGVLMGNVRTGVLPPEVSAWIETQAAMMAVSVDLAKSAAAGSQFASDVFTAGQWREAVAAGKVSPRLERMLMDSLGLDQDARMRRLEKRMEEQLAAEAMEGFPEISEEARGRLPHPETLRENSHPLYGEVRRIWESLKKPTKRRTKEGRTVDLVNEANAYFLPVGVMEDLDTVLEALNERGFGFESITDMLDALDVSISYGKPFYGTASVADESWAMGSPERLDGAGNLAGVDTNTPGGANIGDAALPGNKSAIFKTDKEAVAAGFEEGPYFHGTPKGGFLEFDQSKTSRDRTLEKGAYFFTDSSDAADQYTEDSADGEVIQVRLRFSNPLIQRDDVIAALEDADAFKNFDTWDEQIDAMLQEGTAVEDGENLFVYGTYNQDLIDYANANGFDAIRTVDDAVDSLGRRIVSWGVLSPAQIAIIDPARFNQSPPATSGESFAMSTHGLMRLEAAIAKRMTRGPDERAEYFEKLRDRLASTVLMLRETKRNLATADLTDTERERNRIRDAMAEAQAIIKALPPEARGRVPFSVNDILDADTERGQINGLIRLIDRADEALEVVLKQEYQEAFETLLDLAKPNLQQNKQVRGRLTPETQRMVGRVMEAVVLTPAELAVKLPAKTAELEALENSQPDGPEAIAAAQAQLIELSQDLVILETFGALSTLDAAATAHAYEQLKSIFVTGRTTRKILDEARRNEINEAKAEVLGTLAAVDQAKHAEAMAARGVRLGVEEFRLGMSSFHQVIEWIFPRSTVARDFQDKIRRADRAFVRAKIEAKDRFDRFTFTAWNLTGVSRTRKRNRILADISRNRTWNITLQEGVKFQNEKLTEEQAAAILDGTMKTGWETDMVAMTSLRQALADFRMQRLKAQNEDKRFTSKVIRFQRLVGRGTPGAFVASDLQALYFLQLYAQEQYRPALDKYGFTESVMEAMERQLNPKAADIGDFLRDEYDAEWNRLNPVYRAIYGLDMPKIRNYAPGMFEHLDAKGGTDSTIDPYGGAAGVNAMSAGFTKQRTHHMARPKLTNALAGYWSHFEATEYFIAYAEILRDARQIFRNPELRRAIEGNYGPKTARLFSQWLDALEVDGNFRAAEMSALAEMTQKALSTQSAVGLAFNTGVLFKQLSAAMGSILEMPTKQAVSGLIRAIRNPKTLRPIWESEAIQQRVLMGINPEDKRLLDAARANPSLIIELLDIGRLPIAYADAVFTTLGAALSYNYHLAEALKAGMAPAAAEASALAAASRVIERTAQPVTTQDKSMAEVSAKGFAKFLFLFKSDPRQKLAIAAEAVASFQRPGKGQKARAGRRLLWSWVMYGLMAEAMTDVWAAISRDDDDPERWNWGDYAAAALTGPIAGLPLLGAGIEYLAAETIGTGGFTGGQNPIESGMQRIIPAHRKLLRQLTDEDAEDVSIQDILTAAQQTTAAIALAAGAFDPRAAILPAGVRLVRDAYGIGSNIVGMFLEDTPDDTALEIIRPIAEAQASTRSGRSEEIAAMAKTLAKLPPAARADTLQELDSTTRAAVMRRLRAASMTSSEAALSRLTVENRALAIEQITATLPPSERETYLARLRSLGLAE